MRPLATLCLLTCSLPALAAEPDELAGSPRRLGTPRLRHGAVITSLAYAPAGQWLASAGGTLVRIWDPAAGKEVQRIELGPLPRGQPAVAFAPDGRVLAVANGYQVHLWDLVGKKLLRTLPSKDCPAEAVVFSPDGKQLAVANGGVTIWDWRAGKVLHALQTTRPPGRALAYSPDGKLLAAGDLRVGIGERVRLWDPASGGFLRLLGEPDSEVRALAFAPDGKHLATVSKLGSVQVWDAADGSQRWTASPVGLRPDRPLANPESLAWAPAGRSLFATAAVEQHVSTWAADGGDQLRVLHGPTEGVACLAVSPDGHWLAGGGLDGCIRQWAVASGKEQDQGVGHGGAILSLGFVGQNLASAGDDGRVCLWDPVTAKQLERWNIDLTDSEMMAWGRERLSSFRIDPGRREFDDVPRVLLDQWDLKTGRLQPVEQVAGDGLVALAAGRRFTAGSHPDLAEMLSGYVLLGDRPKQVASALPGGLKGVVVEFAIAKRAEESPRGRKSVADFLAGNSPIHWALAAPDGRTFALFHQGKLALYEAGSRRNLCELSLPATRLHPLRVLRDRVAFAADGRTIALPGENGAIVVHDVATGAEVRRFSTGQGEVTALACSADGRLLASGGIDATILLWNAATPPRAIQLTAAELDGCWAALIGADAAAARQAGWRLVDSPAQALTLLRDRLRPTPVVTAAQLDRLLADLDSNQFEQRQRATVELERLGLIVEPRLRQALADNPPLEARQRIETILGKLPKLGQLTPDDLRAIRAVAVLEKIGGDTARRLLRDLAAAEPRARLTREAQQALERLP